MPTLRVIVACVVLFKGLQAQDIPNVCDVHQKCSCCVNNETCLAIYQGCDRCSTSFPEYTCLGPCHGGIHKCTSDCDVGGFCTIPCKDGYWGGKCILKCPASCISCSQTYRKTNECFKCDTGKYGRNCSDFCPINCFDGTCEKDTGICLSCNPGKYGTYCSGECPANCAESTCEKSTGSCFSCKPGYYGYSCPAKCPENCDKSICEKTNGKCLSCKQGYYGHKCSEKCPTFCHLTCDMMSGYCDRCTGGYHGYKCDMNCPSNCDSMICQQDNGNCTDGCKSNFEGAKCDSCKSGKYGEECSKSCSQGCKNNSCDRKQGNCTFGCKVGFTDSQFCCANNSYCVTCASSSTCKICRNSTYGSQCELQCPDKCNGSCEMHTGKCMGCSAGYYGDNCSMDCNKLCIYSLCDMYDGLCSIGCSNNYTAKRCVEHTQDLPQVIIVAYRSVSTGVLIGLTTICVILAGILSTYCIRKRIRRRKRQQVNVVTSTYDSLQSNSRNTTSEYSNPAPLRRIDDAKDPVYINTVHDAQSQI